MTKKEQEKKIVISKEEEARNRINFIINERI